MPDKLGVSNDLAATLGGGELIGPTFSLGRPLLPRERRNPALIPHFARRTLVSKPVFVAPPPGVPGGGGPGGDGGGGDGE